MSSQILGVASCSNKRQISITFGEDNPMKINTDTMGKLAVRIVESISNQQMPTLIYNEDGNANIVDMSDDLQYYVIPKNVNNFHVYKTETSISATAASSRLTSLIHQMKQKRSGEISSTHSNKKTMTLSQAGVKKKAQANTLKSKTLTVGFKYKCDDQPEYVQLKKGHGGGIIDLDLNANKHYTVNDVIDLAKARFEKADKLAPVYFNSSTIKLGFFTGTPFSQFLDNEGKEIDLWSYVKANKNGSVPLKLYLYVYQPDISSLFGEITSGKSDGLKTIKSAVNSNNEILQKKRTLSGMESIHSSHKFQKTLTEELFNKRRESHGSSFINNEIPADTETCNEKIATLEYPCISYLKKNDVEVEQNLKTKTIDAIQNNIQDNQENNITFFDDDNDDTESIGDIYRVSILYAEKNISEYSGNVSTYFRRKPELWEDKKHEIYPEIEYTDFNPLEHGWIELAQISLNNSNLLDINENEQGQKIYCFHGLKNPPEPHSVVYGADELFGKCDGAFGFGIIAACTTACRPQYQWYCNNVPFASGSHLPWYSLTKPLCDTDSYTCRHTCNKTQLEIERGEKENEWLIRDVTTPVGPIIPAPGTGDLIQPAANSIADNFIKPTSQNTADKSVNKLETINHITDGSSLELIEKNELTFLSLLGEGAMGKVHMGQYYGTTVAIKSVTQRRIKYSSTQIKKINQEMKVLGSLRHENIIIPMGACQEDKVYHIVMEYVPGYCLSDIIFEEEIKIKYKLTTPKKHSISHQLINAIMYLHNKKLPVIHRDINPENIMCTEDFRVNLCGMGISKFQQNSLMTTVGGIAKGTQLYLAPELLSMTPTESTKFTDVWATACTLVELYSGDLVWKVDEEKEEKLIDVINRQKVPDLEKIPVEIKPILSTCFSKIPVERSLYELQSKFSEMSTSQYN